MGGESAYDAEANALVYQTVEFREFESASGDALASRSFRGLAAWAGIGHGENRVGTKCFFVKYFALKSTLPWSTRRRIFELCVCAPLVRNFARPHSYLGYNSGHR